MRKLYVSISKKVLILLMLLFASTVFMSGCTLIDSINDKIEEVIATEVTISTHSVYVPLDYEALDGREVMDIENEKGYARSYDREYIGEGLAERTCMTSDLTFLKAYPKPNAIAVYPYTYEFIGWYTHEPYVLITSSEDFQLTMSGDMITDYYAHFTLQSATIDFLDEAGENIETIRVPLGVEVGPYLLEEAPEKLGYSLVGWKYKEYYFENNYNIYNWIEVSYSMIIRGHKNLYAVYEYDK
jgi:hypothetical protein